MQVKYYTELNIDVRDIQSGWILHGVNCKGVMGSGIARTLRIKYPEIYTEYKELCDQFGSTNLGMTDIVRISDAITVINCFTQEIFGYDKDSTYADINAIRACMAAVLDQVWFDDYHLNTKPSNIYLPRIGCGLGGLEWDGEVEPIVNAFALECKHLGVKVVVIDNKSRNT